MHETNPKIRKEFIERETKNARKTIDEGFDMIDKHIAGYEKLSQKYQEKADRLFETPIDKLTDNDLQEGINLIENLSLYGDVKWLIEDELLSRIDED